VRIENGGVLNPCSYLQLNQGHPPEETNRALHAKVPIPRGLFLGLYLLVVLGWPVIGQEYDGYWRFGEAFSEVVIGCDEWPLQVMGHSGV